MGYKKKVLEMPICSSKGDTDAGIQGCGERLRNTHFMTSVVAT